MYPGRGTKNATPMVSLSQCVHSYANIVTYVIILQLDLWKWLCYQFLQNFWVPILIRIGWSSHLVHVQLKSIILLWDGIRLRTERRYFMSSTLLKLGNQYFNMQLSLTYPAEAERASFTGLYVRTYSAISVVFLFPPSCIPCVACCSANKMHSYFPAPLFYGKFKIFFQIVVRFLLINCQSFWTFQRTFLAYNLLQRYCYLNF